jgi:TPR repeat protein
MIMAMNLNYEPAITHSRYNITNLKMQNYSNTLKFYQETQHYMPSCDALGSYYYSESEYEKAFELWKLAADNGYIHAMKNVAFAYIKRIGVKQNFMKAIKYCQMGIDQKCFHCMLFLGKIYHKGDDTVLNCYAAEKYYKMAIDNGNLDAIKFLIQLYNETEIKNNKEPIIQYLLKIGRVDELINIYNFDNEDIKFIKECDKLEKQCQEFMCACNESVDCINTNEAVLMIEI